jgi:hypothetical protein
MKSTLEMMMALQKIQETIFRKAKQRTDIHYSEGKGVLVVAEGMPLIKENILFKVDEAIFRSGSIKITRVVRV